MSDPAILGALRLGNFQLGSVPTLEAALRRTRVRITLGGAETRATTAASRARLGSVTVHDVVNESPNTCAVTFEGVAPIGGQDLRIALGPYPRVLFSGQVQTDALSYELRPGQLAWPCTGIDDAGRANAKRPFGTWTEVSASIVAEYLLTTFAPSYSAAGIVGGLPPVSVNFDGSEGMSGCFAQLARLIGGYFRFEDGVAYLFQTDMADPPDDIDDTPGRFLDDPPIRVTTDDSQIRTRVYGKGHGEPTVAAVAVGATIVPLENAGAWFNPAGGLAISDTQRLSYTGLGYFYAPLETPWTVRTGPITVRSWVGLAWAPALALYVAIAGNGSSQDVMTSPDGITWTARTPAASSTWRAVTWSDAVALFVVVSTAGLVMTSPDGITWTAQTAAAASQWIAIVWAPALSLFVVVGASGANQVMTSPDGITWTARTAAAALQWSGVAWSASLGLFAACAFLGGANCMMTSPDGITWTQRTTPTTAFNAIAWSPDLALFVAVGGAVGVGVAISSPDGITWTARTAASGNTWEDVIWVPELQLFVAVASNGAGDSGSRVMTSGDGIAWSGHLTPAVSTWYAVAWAPSLARLTAVGFTGTAAVVQIMTNAPLITETLTGVTGIAVALPSGAPVNIWVQRDDLAAQADRIALELAQGRVSDGVVEGPPIVDERRGEASLTALCDVTLQLFARAIVTVAYACRDLKTKSGKPVVFNVASPPIHTTLTIQSVDISEIDVYPGVAPKFVVSASSVRFSLDDLFRQLLAQAGS